MDGVKECLKQGLCGRGDGKAAVVTLPAARRGLLHISPTADGLDAKIKAGVIRFTGCDCGYKRARFSATCHHGRFCQSQEQEYGDCVGGGGDVCRAGVEAGFSGEHKPVFTRMIGGGSSGPARGIQDCSFCGRAMCIACPWKWLLHFECEDCLASSTSVETKWVHV